MLAVDAAHWWGPLGYFYRGLMDNALADPFGALVTLFLGSVILKIGRRWWMRLAWRWWARHGHHVHRARTWWHAPMVERAEAHHAEKLAQAERHHAAALEAIAAVIPAESTKEPT